MRQRSALACASLLIPLLLSAGRSLGLINPQFTPRELADQAESILLLRLRPADAKGIVRTEVVGRLKGEPPAGPPLVNLASTPLAEHARTVRGLIERLGDEPALFLCGKGGGSNRAHMHLRGQWVVLARDKGNAWNMESISPEMQGVWAGGTDMLIRLLDLLIRSPRLKVPVAEGCSWAETELKIGTVRGKVHGAQAVCLGDPNRPHLYVAAEGGDRLFQYDPQQKRFADLTESAGLASRSTAWAWGDFNADGRLDLASASRGGLALCLGQPDGGSPNAMHRVWGPTFRAPAPVAAAAAAAAAVDGDCLGLALLGVPGSRRPGLLWTGPTGPAILLLDDDACLPAGGRQGRAVERKALELPPGAAASLGRPGSALAADLDADGLPDVLWPGQKGSLFWKGRGRAGFERPQPCAVALGEDRAAAFLGDYDADGLLDVAVISESACMIWQNRGGGRFEESLCQSGEIEYTFKGGGLGGCTCDFNGDGLQDLVIFNARHGPLLFFNRGFRSFGHAHRLDLVEQGRLEEAHQGQQAGAAADFNGDGAADLALVLPGGDVYIILREATEKPLAARAVMPPGGDFAGPLAVTARTGQRGLGAWGLAADGSVALICQPEKGPITLTWRFPGAAEQKRVVALLGSAVTVAVQGDAPGGRP